METYGIMITRSDGVRKLIRDTRGSKQDMEDAKKSIERAYVHGNLGTPPQMEVVRVDEER
jgi:hypothetical protein